MSNKYYLNQHTGNTKTEAKGTKTGSKAKPSTNSKEATSKNIVPKT